MALFGKSKSNTAVFDAPTQVVSDISGDYTLDTTHSRLGFNVKHAMVTTVRGAFEEWSGTAHIDAATPANSTVELTIKTASITTGVTDRDNHLRSADFFDADANPDITFKSTHVEADSNDWAITGDLTIKGIAKPVTIEFELSGSAKDVFGNMRVGFEGTAAINRKDWGLTWNAALETGGVMVSEKVKLDFDISAIQTPKA